MCVVQCQVGVVLVVSCLLCAVCSLHAATQKPIITIHADEKTVTGVLHGTCEALGGRKRIPWLFADFRDFRPPEHARRTRPGPTLAPQCSRGPPACPATESTRKDPRAEEQNADVQETSICYIVFQGSPSACGRLEILGDVASCKGGTQAIPFT